MKEKLVIGVLALSLLSLSGFALDMGLLVGSTTNPTETVYGLSGGWGFFVPMVKFEIEYYNMKSRAYEALTAGLKLRKRFGKIAPYAILGAGTEFEKISFKSDNYDTFLFVGGGVHLFMIDFLSLRADLRFLNYSKYNKTRISVGIFFHI